MTNFEQYIWKSDNLILKTNNKKAKNKLNVWMSFRAYYW